MSCKSVESIHQCKSLPVRQAGVIQTSYDIVKTYGGGDEFGDERRGRCNVHYQAANKHNSSMKGFLIFIFLFISVTAYGQDTIRVQRASLDSLSALISNHKNKDSLRVQLLNDYARYAYMTRIFSKG